MKLVFQGMTMQAVIPADKQWYEEFTITYTPLAGTEYGIWQKTTGVAQVSMVLDKLKSWPLVCDEALASWLNNQGGARKYAAGDPLPINEAVIKALPGLAFEMIYLAIMGMLPQPSGKTGLQQKAEAEKN